MAQWKMAQIIQRKEQADDQDDAVEDPLDERRRQCHRRGNFAPARQQEAADQFASPQWQHFVGEKADIDRADRAPGGSRAYRPKDKAPAIALDDVNENVGESAHSHPSPIEFLDLLAEFPPVHTVQGPCETGQRQDNGDDGEDSGSDSTLGTFGGHSDHHSSGCFVRSTIRKHVLYWVQRGSRTSARATMDHKELQLLSTSTAFKPPNAKELDKAYSTSAGRAWVGITARSQAGSGAGVIAVRGSTPQRTGGRGAGASPAPAARRVGAGQD